MVEILEGVIVVPVRPIPVPHAPDVICLMCWAKRFKKGPWPQRSLHSRQNLSLRPYFSEASQKKRGISWTPVDERENWSGKGQILTKYYQMQT